MAWSRGRQDTCAYKQFLAESVGEFQYVVDPCRYYHPAPRRFEFGLPAGNDVSIVKNMVDLESDLFGIDRKLSRCDALKYLNPCPNTDMNACKPNQIVMRGNPANMGRVIDVQLYHLPPAQMFSYKPIQMDPYMNNNVRA
jgi:hypothetical protein